METAAVRGYFNNHYGARAVVNALEFKEMLGMVLSDKKKALLENARINFGRPSTQLTLDKNVDLGEVVKTAREALSMDKEAKVSILAFIDETVKIYDALLNTITPFYGVYKEDFFRVEFADDYQKFINIYHSSVRTQVFASCSQVQEALNHLAQRKFINKFPFLRKKYEKLRNSPDLKLLRDYTVPETMDAIYNEFDVNLRQILNLVGKGEIQEASNQLQFFLSETRNSFNHMQKQLGELHLIQSKL